MYDHDSVVPWKSLGLGLGLGLGELNIEIAPNGRRNIIFLCGNLVVLQKSNSIKNIAFLVFLQSFPVTA